MINYLEILRKSEIEYLNLSLDEVKKRLNDKNNNYQLINNAKKCIFKYNYIPNRNMVYNYLANLNKDSIQAIDIDLIKEYDYSIGKKYEEAYSKINYIPSQGIVGQVNGFVNFILEKINKVKIIHRSDKNIDYSDISDDFNNFFNYENIIEPCNKLSECGISKVPLEDIEESEFVHFVYNYRKKHVFPKFFENTKVLITHFSVPSKHKEIKDFSFDEDLLEDLDIKQKLLLCKIVDKYDKKIKYVKEHNFKNNNKNYLSYCKTENGKTTHCYFEHKDEKSIHNTEIAYNLIKKHFFTDEKNLFDNRDFFIIKKKLEATVYDVNNKVFYIFDIHKAFYTTPFNIIKETCKTLFNEKGEMSFHFDVLWDFFINIKKTNNDINFLPVTKYSGLIFRLYLKSILSSINCDNYYVYVDDFIVYGTEESSEKTFDKIFHILKNNERQLSSFSIYNKSIHDSMTFLNQKYKFDRRSLNENQELDIEISLESNYSGDYFNKTLIKMFKDNLNINSTNSLNINFIKKDEDNKELYNVCEICRDNKKDLCLSCGHLLCHSCFYNVKKINTLFSCPFCGESSRIFTKVFL